MVRDREKYPSSRQSGCRHKLPTCILIYATSQCIFCPAAKEIVEGVLEVHGLPVDTIRKVDCDTEDVRDITALPTIQICEQIIIGLPEEDTLDRALWKLRVNPCFYENSESK